MLRVQCIPRDYTLAKQTYANCRPIKPHAAVAGTLTFLEHHFAILPPSRSSGTVPLTAHRICAYLPSCHSSLDLAVSTTLVCLLVCDWSLSRPCAARCASRPRSLRVSTVPFWYLNIPVGNMIVRCRFTDVACSTIRTAHSCTACSTTRPRATQKRTWA